MFTYPLHDHVLTRDFYYLSSLYVGGQHAACDYIRRIGPTRGAPIMAVANGTVSGIGWDMYSGFFVAIDHTDGFRSFYRHLYGQTPVAVGQQVGQGQIIGNVGNTGWSLGDHLHFDLWNCNKIRDDGAIFYKNGWYAIDPELYLGQEDDDMGMTPEERAELDALRMWQWWHSNLVRDASTTAAFLIQGEFHCFIDSDTWAATGLDEAAVVEVPHEVILIRAPKRGPAATPEEVRGSKTAMGLTLTQIAGALKHTT